MEPAADDRFEVVARGISEAAELPAAGIVQEGSAESVLAEDKNILNILVGRCGDVEAQGSQRQKHKFVETDVVIRIREDLGAEVPSLHLIAGLVIKIAADVVRYRVVSDHNIALLPLWAGGSPVEVV